MEPAYTLEPVARVRTPYPTKFGVPRQPGLVDALEATVEFEPAFRNPDALRGLEGFGYVWLVWSFSHNLRDGGWSPTVRPPILGGTQRLGVFATRSSFRPNGLGLSSVRLLGVETDARYADGSRGPLLRIGGADMVDGTPVFDIKPYLPSSDAHPDAAVGWKERAVWRELQVEIPPDQLGKVPSRLREGLYQLLAQDPRPAYTRDGQEGRVFWVPLENLAVWFRVTSGADGGTGGVLRVVRIDVLDEAQMERLRATGTVEGLGE